MHVYRVTRHRKHPAYYQNKLSTRVCTRRSLTAQIKAIEEAREHARRYGLTEPHIDILKIERAEVGEFEDVTGEFL